MVRSPIAKFCDFMDIKKTSSDSHLHIQISIVASERTQVQHIYFIRISLHNHKSEEFWTKFYPLFMKFEYGIVIIALKLSPKLILSTLYDVIKFHLAKTFVLKSNFSWFGKFSTSLLSIYNKSILKIRELKSRSFSKLKRKGNKTHKKNF